MTTKRLEDFNYSDRPPRILRGGDIVDDRKQRAWDMDLMRARAADYFEKHVGHSDKIHVFPESYKSTVFTFPDDENIARPEDLL